MKKHLPKNLYFPFGNFLFVGDFDARLSLRKIYLSLGRVFNMQYQKFHFPLGTKDNE